MLAQLAPGVTRADHQPWLTRAMQLQPGHHGGLEIFGVSVEGWKISITGASVAGHCPSAMASPGGVPWGCPMAAPQDGGCWLLGSEAGCFARACWQTSAEEACLNHLKEGMGAFGQSTVWGPEK